MRKEMVYATAFTQRIAQVWVSLLLLKTVESIIYKLQQTASRQQTKRVESIKNIS